jgi:hypothetical protein
VLRSLVAFHVGPGFSTTVRLVRTKGWAALDSSVGVVYVRESVSCCRPLLCYFYLGAHPLGAPESLPEEPGLSFFGCSAQRINRGEAPDQASFLFFIFGLNCNKRREGSPNMKPEVGTHVLTISITSIPVATGGVRLGAER